MQLCLRSLPMLPCVHRGGRPSLCVAGRHPLKKKKKVLSLRAQLKRGGGGRGPSSQCCFRPRPSPELWIWGREKRRFLWYRIPLALMRREIPISQPTPTPARKPPVPRPNIPGEPPPPPALLLCKYRAPRRLGGRSLPWPNPCPAGPIPPGSWGCGRKVFLSPYVHVTVLGWNVNNKEECPSVPRVPEGRVFGCTRPPVET